MLAFCRCKRFLNLLRYLDFLKTPHRIDVDISLIRYPCKEAAQIPSDRIHIADGYLSLFLIHCQVIPDIISCDVLQPLIQRCDQFGHTFFVSVQCAKTAVLDSLACQKCVQDLLPSQFACYKLCSLFLDLKSMEFDCHYILQLLQLFIT